MDYFKLSLEEWATGWVGVGTGHTHVCCRGSLRRAYPPFLLPWALSGKLAAGVLQGCLVPAAPGVK